MGNPKNKIQQAKNELSPAMEVADAKDLSKFKVKDQFFNKLKTYIEKATSQEKQIEVDYLSLNIGGVAIIAFKGVALTKAQIAGFDEKAKAHWLESIK